MLKKEYKTLARLEHCKRTGYPKPPMASHDSCETLVRIIHYRHKIFLLLLSAMLYVHTLIEPRKLNVHILSDIRYNVQTMLLLLVFVPGRILGWYSIMCALLPLRMRDLGQRERQRQFTRFMLCYVIKGHNIKVSYSFLSTY